MDEEVTVAPEQEATRPGPAETKRGRSTPTAILIAILVAAVLAESVLLSRGNTDAAARANVIETSQRFLALLTTYNAATLDRQRQAVLAMATGKARTDIQQVTGTGFRTTIQSAQADSRGTVTRASVESVIGDSATALCVVQISTTNKDRKTPRIEEDLIEVSLVHTSSGWKID